MQDECSETEQGRLYLLCAIPSLCFFLVHSARGFLFLFLAVSLLRHSIVRSLCFPLLSVPFSLNG